MQNADTLLCVIQQRGIQRQPLTRVYRHLYNRELYLVAYGRIYRNRGSLTPGATGETADGMTLTKIDTLIDALRHERYRWTPVRRIMIPKPHSRKQRPLGLPTWSDKLLQEVMRMILAAYYEPQFSSASHGFRSGYGCHTALRDIRTRWTGTTWFIEGDITQCFESLDHQILIAILREQIHDERFLRLISGLLKAGYLATWQYHRTYSGTPQGGILSPLLANIYLDRFDQFVETQVVPHYTRGTGRRPNPAYTRVHGRLAYLRKRGDGRSQEAQLLRKRRRTLPANDPMDMTYRRLRYIRYADDFLLGVIGSRHDAEAIKGQLEDFLCTTLHLTLSPEKTLITHGRTQAARFLGYDITVMYDNNKLDTRGRRTINGGIGMKVPAEVIRRACRPYLRHGKPVHRGRWVENSVYSLFMQYQQEYRGLVEYYRLAYNLATAFPRLKWVMEQSLAKTLAKKFRVSVRTIYRRYRTTVTLDTGTYRVLQTTVDRPGRPPLVARWGGIPLRWEPTATLKDNPQPIWNDRRVEVVQRLLADICEMCGYQGRCEVHHIRALKDLAQPGRRTRPEWMRIMAARRRKTLVVCRECHQQIHQGTANGNHVRT